MESRINVAIIARVKQGDLYEAFKKRGWSTRRAAAELGIRLSKLYDMINLKRVPALTIEQELRLAEVTGKTLEQLFPKEINLQDFLNGKRELVAFRDCLPGELSGSGIRCLPVPMSPGKEDLLAHAMEIVTRLELSTSGSSRSRRDLTEREREVLELRVIRGLTLEDTAELLGVTRQRVRKVELRVRQAIRETVQRIHPEMP